MTLTSISVGFAYGHLSGLVRALQKHEDGITLNEGQISLIAACMIFCCTVGITFLAFCGDSIGRRWCSTLFSIPLLLSWILVYFARGFILLIASRILAGIAAGALTVLNLVAAAELTSPKSRAFFQSIVSMVAPALGTGLGHAFGVIIHWRTLAIAGIILSAIHTCLPLFCVESPHWLASRGKFDECEVAFRQLHGPKRSEAELRMLITFESNKQKRTTVNNGFKKVVAAFRKRYLWGLILMNFFINVYYAAAGKVVFTNLATVMLEEMTGTSDILLYTLLVDGFIVIGTCISCALIRKLSVRVLLFSSGVIANLLLIILSACLYFKSNDVYFQWINVSILAFYYIIVHAGPYPVMDILLGEMFPLEIKLYCFLLSTPAVVSTVVAGIMFMPNLVTAIGYHGLFLLNSVISCICMGYFWVTLPETKGKTLQEIEIYFKKNDFDECNVSFDDQVKTFI